MSVILTEEILKTYKSLDENVGTVEINNIRYVVKEDEKEVLRHEYNVGLIVNTLKSTHFPNTYSYDDRRLIIDLMPGVKALDFFSKIYKQKKKEDITNYSDFYAFILELILILCEANEKIDFCHYDLHGGNILIQEHELLNKTYYFRNKSHTIISKYHISIIDFGYSHVKGLENVFECYDTVKAGALVSGVHPYVNDSAYDICTIVVRNLTMGMVPRISTEFKSRIDTYVKNLGYYTFTPEYNIGFFFYGRQRNLELREIFNLKPELGTLCSPNLNSDLTLEEFYKLWSSVPENERNKYKYIFSGIIVKYKLRKINMGLLDEFIDFMIHSLKN